MYESKPINVKTLSEATTFIFDYLPSAEKHREAMEKQEEMLVKDLMKLCNDVKYQLYKACTEGKESCKVIVSKVDYPNCVSIYDLTKKMQAILADLHYKVEFNSYNRPAVYYSLLITW